MAIFSLNKISLLAPKTQDRIGSQSILGKHPVFALMQDGTYPSAFCSEDIWLFIDNYTGYGLLFMCLTKSYFLMIYLESTLLYYPLYSSG